MNGGADAAALRDLAARAPGDTRAGRRTRCVAARSPSDAAIRAHGGAPRGRRLHPAAEGAASLAAFEGIAGPRVAKVVVLTLGDGLAMAVVAALDRVDVRPVEELTGTAAGLAGEEHVADRLQPCEPGAAVPIALFRVPIFADDRLLRSSAILLPAGTAVDAAVLDTSEWIWRERIQPVTHLGRAGRRRWRVEPSPGGWTPRAEPGAQPWRERSAPSQLVSGAGPARSGS